MNTTTQNHTDSPALPVDVRAARALYRAGFTPEATRLRMAVREALLDPNTPRALHRARGALQALLDHTGGAFACETHQVAGECDPECLALASLMSAPDHSTPWDTTGCTHVTADYLEPTHHLALVASTVVWERNA